ncbi:helix-turn-helix transcriptional regulator [Agrobacterium rubi]|uniref:LuxR family transcriptional regulator n=2 Tax=Agrobacterium rubi TaxID=28099 RepID=A0AAE7R5S7_9HYPH|nr:LuxR family transcriptional regulator [Agrobacterium rubi]MBP1879688.1 LuxR family transcriptional regulator [Agrobacterium rubi]MCL6654497.1 LuxR family transcriptional regulator [Agrobacterium rubi]NTE87671.1 LuxR family transcriptional regulator [Agrobacterium rubi]NTF03525.1 LuxR family transcriptional regulator [Agrobacterium rubi]NTF08750.1 LuxR family transcriptional regulator [Agrobacterium rubi]
MHNVFQFLTVCSEATTEHQFLTIFHELTRSLGYEYYRVVRRDADDLTLTGNVLADHLPEGWREVYVEKKYGGIDPVKRSFGLLHQPFRCRDVVGLLPQATQRKRAAKLFQDAARFGLREAYAFPVHGRSGLLGGSFILGEGRLFSDSELFIIDTAMRVAFWRLLEFAGQSNDLLSIPDLSITQFTRRELDVLMLLAQGKTSPEIGKTLSISSHTADWYINGIQRKLDAKNRQHVVALALRHGIIS